MAETGDIVVQLNECVERKDFNGAFSLVREKGADLVKQLKPASVCEALKKASEDRLVQSFIDGVEFGMHPLDESLMRIEKLIAFNAKPLVLSKAWGVGKVRKMDDFYRRITVDFKTKRGHQFTYMAATDMLETPSDDHILVYREANPEAVETMLKEKPGELVKRFLQSYGDMTLVKLEDTMVANGFVKSVNWKGFWDKARTALKADKTVYVPVKRSEPLQILSAEEDYGSKWLARLEGEKDPMVILAMVREFVAQKKYETANENFKTVIANRLAFAVTGARKVDDALYARLACLVNSLGLSEPPAMEMRNYLWERKRYIKAAATLPAREVGAMISFLACDDESRRRIYAAVPSLCYAAVCEVVDLFKGDAECRATLGRLMKEPVAPATLTALMVGKYEQFREWTELPPLITLLNHAVALGEGRQNGETLRMQNIVRRLFADTKWLTKVFGWLPPEGRMLFFERFQASIAWDPSTHHTIVMRMVRIAPETESHLVRLEKKREYARLTSFRSYAMKKAEYLKLINEDMPANVRRIEFAKSYGDLSENAEYQYAKDEQRTLMQKQTLMQQDLESVKPSDFADASVDEVMPGVTVVISANGVEKTYHILGEWDSDGDMGILSYKARLAENMLGKKAGDEFELPGEGTAAFGRIVQIRPLGDDIREWMKLPVGMQI